MTELLISQLSARTGVPASTLRYYEQIGLLPADRSPGGYRLYDEHAEDRLRFITAAKRLDLSLESIRAVLRTWEDEACRTVKAQLRPMITERIADTESGVAALQDLASSLRAGLRRLDGLPDRDHACDSSCVVIADPAGRPLSVPVEGHGAEHGAEVTVACSLGAGEQQERLAHWRALLGRGSISDTARGVTVELPVAVAGELTGLIVAEQECCPFLEFELTFAGPRVTLSIGAPGPEPVSHLLPERAS